MDQETRNQLQTATQELRQLLETEFSEQLGGTFDILPSGTIAPEPGPHLNERQRLTRQKLVEAIEHLVDGGKKPKEAVEDYIREAAFTFLNRFVALRMLEARGLLQPCVSKGDQSSGFKEFCGLAPGLASLPDGGYRLYLECLFDELSVEIKVLFNRRDAASLLWPRRPALVKLLEILERNGLSSAWSADETIGWVYQGFNAEELERAFREARLSGKKFEARDIPAVTQLFTQRWIVRYLVENTLGRFWVDMHPDSEIAASYDYLVPLDGERSTPLKSVRDIRLLDPSCGTMHFGLVAFDLFADMYREEIKHAGQPGWPKRPPVASNEDIPAAILANNLHGIDIDNRAVQLSALTLYLKAKALNPNVRLTETRLACADVHMLNGGHLAEFLEVAGLDKRPIYGRVLKALQQRLQDAEQLGSLLRLEEEIRELIDKERQLYQKEGRQADLFGWSKDQFESDAGRREFWETLEIQIGQALDAFAREQAEHGNDQSYFAGETTKGLRLLDVLSKRYDVVVTNPPYLSARKMNARMKKLVADSYKAAKGDLYAAFILRCIELAAETGRVGMLTMHSFMFISSYEELRNQVRAKVAVDTLAHAGPALFSVGNPGTLQTAAFVLRREPNEEARNASVGTYFRLVKQPDAESKRQRFEQAVDNLRSGNSDSNVYRYQQADFDAIPGSPWVYWITPGIRSIFGRYSKLGDISGTHCGMTTSDNFRYLRFWWEVGIENVNRSCLTRNDARESGARWFPYMKGGGFQRWYGKQSHVVNWHDDGSEIRNSPSFPRAANRYFNCGVTWTEMGTGRFSARFSPGGFVFDVKGSCAFPNDPFAMLAVLNSSFSHYALSLLNPTVSKQVGDVARIPVPNMVDAQFNELVMEAIDICTEDSQADESTFDFVSPQDIINGITITGQRLARFNVLEQHIDDEVFRLYDICDEDREAINAEIVDASMSDEGEEEAFPADSDDNESDELESVLTRDDLARQWLSYSIGIVLGRFQPGIDNALGRGDFSAEVSEELRALADSDGVLVLDAGHPHDLAAKVLEALTLMLGDEDARECIHEATGRDGDMEEELRRYLGGNFFKEHLQKYRKRPTYWLLQSPRKTYGIYLFHERISKDTLYRLRSDQYVGSKLKLLNGRLTGLQREAEGASGRALKTLQKTIEETEAARDDLQEFASKIDDLIALGYDPNIDDGVLINMAPLWQLIPSWSAEPKKCWAKLVAGDYDWSHMAMHLWPERVVPRCIENASYAIAHGLDDVFWKQDDRDRFQPKSEPDGGWQPVIEQLVADRQRPGVAEAREKLIAEGAKAAPKKRRGRKKS